MDARTAQVLERLGMLAKMAEQYAGAPGGGPEDLDSAIDSCRKRGPGADYPGIIASNGAWLGEWLRREFRARWIGLHEPSAPRLAVAGRVISPMQAVERRLKSDSAPSLTDIVARVREWKASTPDREEILKTNRAAWDRLKTSKRFAGLDPEMLRKESALEAVDPWIAEEGLEGKRVACLGAGGGRQGPLHAAAGAAEVVVVDVSDEQLELDRRAAREHGLKIRTVQGSIDDLSILEAGTFDIAIQPVASSYVPDLDPVHREVARVLRGGALYVSQHKQPAALRAEPPVEGLREPGCAEFPHSLEELIGGLCRAGFVIEDLVEPPLADALAAPGTFEARAVELPPYLKIKARRRS